MSLSRRSLITGLISLVAAPAIVRVSSLMPVKVMEEAAEFEFSGFYSIVPASVAQHADLLAVYDSIERNYRKICATSYFSLQGRFV